MLLNNRGQAALTDALYFLLIVSILAVILFYFSANYGITVRQKVLSQYWGGYATSALETILYSSTPRIPGQSLEDATEVDYLLAAVKEDFADDGEIDETQDVLKQNVVGIMQPVAEKFDYLFYIYMLDDKEFAFVMIYTRDFKSAGGQGDVHIYYCKPQTLNDLENITESAGSLAQSDARIQLVEYNEFGKPEFPVAHVNLSLWIPTPLDIASQSNLNCTLAETISSA